MHTTEKQTSMAILLGSTALVVAAALPGTALALSFDAGEWLFDVDTSLSAAAQWRTESRDKTLSTDVDNYNLNDGNNNFDTGLVSAKGSFILEVAGQREDFSFFIRTDGLYDYVYEDEKSDLSRKNYLTYNGAIPNGGKLKRGEFPDGTRSEHGKRVRLLEAFINYEFDLAEQSGGLRLGRQVIAWGEAVIYQGVNTMQNPIDGGVALSPGVEAKEIFLPTGAIDLKWNFSESISAEAYYKLEWEETTQPGVGSFLSSSDITGPGAQRVVLAPASLSGKVIKADDPDDFGQWGTALRYLTEDGTSLGISYTRSHANGPGSRFILDLAGETTSQEIYLEDIDFWQFGVNTTWGEASIYADLAYSHNAQFIDQTQYLNDQGQLVAADVARGDYRQAVVGITDGYTAFPWLSPQIILTAEAIYQSNDLGEDDKEGTPYIATDDAWGYQFLVILKYYSVIAGMDLDVPISFRHDVEGYGASMLKNVLIEGQKWASVGVNALYLNNWEIQAKYSFYFGNDDPGEPVLSDRDNVALSIKYKF
jgi:Protein of unknown function (DUF1302)